MAYIYQITNLINGKIYIGKTERSVSERWREHIKDSQKEENKHRPLYRAFNKYGLENFSIEIIEECANNQELDIKESYWIKYYNSNDASCGYNLTSGGSGLYNKDRKVNNLVNEEIIFDLWNQGYGVSDIEERTKYSYSSIKIHLKNCPTYSEEESIRRGAKRASQSKNKQISQWTLDGEYVNTYESGVKAEEQTGINRKHISSVIRGKTKTAGGFIWTLGTEKPDINKHKKIDTKKAVYQKTLDGEIINSFPSYSEASRFTGVNIRGIREVINGGQRTAGGFLWELKVDNH